MVSKEESEKYWSFLSRMYVTEESDDPDNPNGIIEHHLSWRSPSEVLLKLAKIKMCRLLLCKSFVELDAFMAVLDKHFSRKQQQQPAAVGLVAKKVQKSGEPSLTKPTPDAPLWAIKRDYHTGMK